MVIWRGDSYSSRGTCTGSSRAARSAGSIDARIDTASMRATTLASVSGSKIGMLASCP